MGLRPTIETEIMRNSRCFFVKYFLFWKAGGSKLDISFFFPPLPTLAVTSFTLFYWKRVVIFLVIGLQLSRHLVVVSSLWCMQVSPSPMFLFLIFSFRFPLYHGWDSRQKALDRMELVYCTGKRRWLGKYISSDAGITAEWK